MKKTILLSICFLLCFRIFAQETKRNSFNVEVSPFLNLNGSDIDNKNRQPNFSQKTNMGSYFGLAYNINSKHFVFFQFATGFRLTPQSIYFESEGKEQYLNMDWYIRYMLGLRFKLSGHNSLTFSFGLNNCYSFRGKGMDDKFITTPYRDYKTGETIDRLVGIYELNWGDRQKDANNGPFIICTSLQIGFENAGILPNNRKCGIALEFSTRIATNAPYGKGNGGTFYKFDSDRNITVVQTFKDKYKTIGLNLFMAIN